MRLCETLKLIFAHECADATLQGVQLALSELLYRARVDRTPVLSKNVPDVAFPYHLGRRFHWFSFRLEEKKIVYILFGNNSEKIVCLTRKYVYQKNITKKKYKMWIYPEYILGMFLLTLLSSIWWVRRRPNAFDTQTDPWDASANLPLVSLEDYTFPIRDRLDLVRASWLPFDSSLSLDEVDDYLIQFLALSVWWTHPILPTEPRVPWILVTRNRSMVSSILPQHLYTLFRALPKRVELIWIPTSSDQFVLKRNRKPLRGSFQQGVPVRSVQALRQGMYVVRVDALRKKGLRLLPMSYSFERALCVLFRTYTFFTLTQPDSAPILTPFSSIEPPSRLLACTFPRTTRYDPAALRYLLKQPLTDAQIAEYWGICTILWQHHHRSEWILVHAYDFAISSDIYQQIENGLDALIHQFPSADGFLLAHDDKQHRIYAALVRSEAIRQHLFRLFPILHPLDVALRLHWNVFVTRIQE